MSVTDISDAFQGTYLWPFKALFSQTRADPPTISIFHSGSFRGFDYKSVCLAQSCLVALGYFPTDRLILPALPIQSFHFTANYNDGFSSSFFEIRFGTVEGIGLYSDADGRQQLLHGKCSLILDLLTELSLSILSNIIISSRGADT